MGSPIGFTRPFVTTTLFAHIQIMKKPYSTYAPGHFAVSKLSPNAALKPLILLVFRAFLRAEIAVFAFLYVVFFWLQAEKVVRMRR